MHRIATTGIPGRCPGSINNNNDRLRKLYAEIRDLAVVMDPTQESNFTANVRLMAGENLLPQDWVNGARVAVADIVERKLLASDTGWVTKTKRICYLRQTRTVKFFETVPLAAIGSFLDYEELIWDGQSFQQSASPDGYTYHLTRSIDSGD